jgi:NAD(P)-dependent dehydrogenase (short-subunit alcohol dehydrogenase family)
MGGFRIVRKLLILGGNSDISKAAATLLEKEFEIISLDRKKLDLNGENATDEIQGFLSRNNPDVILHCGGIFQFNDVAEFDSTFNVNLRSHWTVAKYYFDVKPTKLIRFISIGSSTYKQGRMRFILYASSRAALYSMWQGGIEFAPQNFKWGLINPVRVNTKHVIGLPPKLGALEPDDVAKVIAIMALSMTESYSVDLDYKE